MEIRKSEVKQHALEHHALILSISLFLIDIEKIETSDLRQVIAAPSKAPSPKSVAASPPPAPVPVPVPAARPVDDTPGDAPDAGGSPDGGLWPGRLPGPMPKAHDATAPSGEPPAPPNPFDKWKVYEKRKKKP